MRHISHLSAIVSRYDAILLDLWGVVHDGTQLYPGVKDTLTRLREQQKKIIMVSNAPRRTHKAVQVLSQLGVTPELYDRVITSGELGYEWLASGQCDWGKRYYYIGPFKDVDVLEGLDFTRADDIKECDFLLNVGFGSEEESAENWQPILRAAKAQALPMLCLNPDLEVVKITGERFACAGVLAADYERMGGEVKYFGKPFPEIYHYCMDLLFPSPFPEEGRVGVKQHNHHPGPLPKREREKKKVLAIGDGIATDIAGAVNFGIDAALITGGIFKKDIHRIEELCRKHGAVPQYVMPHLAW